MLYWEVYLGHEWVRGGRCEGRCGVSSYVTNHKQSFNSEERASGDEGLNGQEAQRVSSGERS